MDLAEKAGHQNKLQVLGRDLKPTATPAWEGRRWNTIGIRPTSQRMFTTELMARPEIIFLGHRTAGEFHAGASPISRGRVSAVSNVFFPGCAQTVFLQQATEPLGIHRAANFAIRCLRGRAKYWTIDRAGSGIHKRR